MQLRKLFDDDSAVSPVIGVILMVAITVILAAVIATFVLGLGEQVSQTAPQASFTFDYTEGSNADGDLSNNNNGDGILNMTHAGGETLTASNLGVTGSSVTGATGNWDDGPYGANSEITAGDSLSVRVNSDDTVRITWENDQGSQSATLREWVGPDA